MFPAQLTAVFGKLSVTNRLFILAVYAPTISAGPVFRRRIRAMGIRDRPTALRSPWQNGLRLDLIFGSHNLSSE